MKLNDFYEKALSTLSLSVDDDGYVVIKDEESTNRVTVGKKFLVMATSNHVSTMDDNKVLFNPLQEDSIKGINPSMVKYKALIERKLSVSFNVAQKLLAKLASDMKLQKDASLELNNKFIAKLNKVRKQNMKEIVTEDTIKLLNKIHEASYQKSSNQGMVAISVSKAKVIEGEKYNKVAVVQLPVYEDVCNNPKYAYDIEIKRPADAGIFKVITEYIIGTDDEDKIDYSKFTVGSKSLESPTFISVYKLYYKLAERINKVLKQLSFIDKEICKESMLKLDLALDDLVHIEDFKSQLRLIPKISDNSSVNIPSNTPAAPVAQQAPVNQNVAPVNLAPSAPLTSVQRKLIQMRGGALPAAPVNPNIRGAYGQPATRPVMAVNRPGMARPMDPNMLARLNNATAILQSQATMGYAAPNGYPSAQYVAGAGNFGPMNPIYAQLAQPYVPYMRNR